MPNAVDAAGAVVYNGQLYCFGGGSEKWPVRGQRLRLRADLSAVERNESWVAAVHHGSPYPRFRLAECELLSTDPIRAFYTRTR